MKKILFMTGTRADFGKMKSLILSTQKNDKFLTSVFVTGMHLNHLHGYTIDEIYKSNIKNVFPFINHDAINHMDRSLANTISGLSYFVANNPQDLIVVHGDRGEALAGAIVGSMNNILVSHIEGGEVSGTIDELIRHSVSKMAHIHFVSNKFAAKRLMQMGERKESIYQIGSPDVDIMLSASLVSVKKVKNYYKIPFEDYGILIYHSVTTEINSLRKNIKIVVDACIESGQNFIVIYPNNDSGSEIILDQFKRFKGLPKFKVFPSTRFEYFLTLLKNSNFIMGNSSAGIREAPYYGIQTINIGNRQNGRGSYKSIINLGHEKDLIVNALNNYKKYESDKSFVDFGDGKSEKHFQKIINQKDFWDTPTQKTFVDK
ncbi:UDP-N-acetylglucosamine 2-epimerase [Prochlorococcus sp. AH-736-E15]|nr:UDP-N-acetylglucosamine 2-epimerase [Prochlorococcus sp. AH-736-E15]